MPKRELASDQGATYCYAKIVREPTLVQYLRVVLHPNLISWVLIHEWGCL